MSAASVRLSPAVKALISAPHALGQAIPAPSKAAAKQLFDNVRSRGERNGVGMESWLTVSTAALVTVNSPATICELFSYAAERQKDVQDQVTAAAVMRETALKCISFSGIPRTINALTALRAHLPEPVKQGLSTEPLRYVMGNCARALAYTLSQPTRDNIDDITSRSRVLWDAIYEPHSVKLLAKLGEAHPDLPVHILNSHYGPALSDPLDTFPAGHFKIGRILTSVVAMACLRAQQGVAPQLTSHVFGLKKALLEGGGAEGEAALKGQEWLTSDEGVQWILESTDDISGIVGEGRTTFAGQIKSKL